MYLSSMDTVKKNNLNVEADFYICMLNGYHPVITMNQAIDSSFLINMISQEKTREDFLKLIKQQYIKVALYRSCSAKSYLLERLKDNITSLENGVIVFRFSSLDFLDLNHYSPKQLRRIFKAMQKYLNCGEPLPNNIFELNTNHRDNIRDLCNTVSEIDKAVCDNYLSTIEPKVSLKKRLRKKIEVILANEEIDIEQGYYRLLQKVKKSLKNEKREIGRSGIYNIVEEIANERKEYETKDINMVKELVDICYNERLAESICDAEPNTIVIPGEFQEVCNNVVQEKEAKKIRQQYLIKDDEQIEPLKKKVMQTTEIMDWKMLLHLLNEINCIESEHKGICWKDARMEYYLRNRNVPFAIKVETLMLEAVCFVISKCLNDNIKIPHSCGLMLLNNTDIDFITNILEFINDRFFGEREERLKQLLCIPSKDDVQKIRTEIQMIESVNDYTIWTCVKI